MNPLLVVVVILFVGAIAAVVAALTTKRDTATERLRKLTSPPEPEKPQRAVRKKQKRDLLPTLSAVLSGRGLTEKLFAEVTAAGVPIRPSEFLGIIAAAVILSQIVALVVAKNALGNVLFGAVAIAAPIGVLRSLQQKRRNLFNAQIMDALTMIASSLRSGFSFLRAVQSVATELPPPIAQEFQRVVDEVNVGRSTEDALRSVVDRVKSYDFDLVVSAVLIQLQVGGNLADILDSIAETLRERVQLVGEMRAMTAEGKMSGILLMVLPVALVLLLMAVSPSYIEKLVYERLGQYMLGAAAVLQLIGGIIIKRMLVLDD